RSNNVWRTCNRNRAQRTRPIPTQQEVQSLVAHSTRLDDHTAAWRHNALTDQTTFAAVRVIIPISVTVATIPIRADADARTERANLDAYALRVSCRWPCRTCNREFGLC